MMNSSPHSVMGSTFCPVSNEENLDDNGLAEVAKTIKVSNTSSAMPQSTHPRSGTDNVKPKYTLSYFLAANSGEKDFTLEHKYHPVAVFGLRKKQDNLKSLLEEGLGLKRVTTINILNMRIGLNEPPRHWEKLSYPTKKLFDRAIKNISKISDRAPLQTSEKSHRGLMFRWSNHLYANKEKLDPIIRIRTLLNQTVANGNKDNLEQFILKNSEADCDTEELCKHLKYLILELGCKNSAEMEQALGSYKTEKGVSLLSSENYKDLYHLYNFHFFRNTSKLGLRFFVEERFDIAYAWNAEENAEINLDEAKCRPWKRGQRRDDIQLNRPVHEWITYSEIRSILRNKNFVFSSNKPFKFFYALDYRMKRFNVEMARSLRSDHWVKL
ncbi:hypothetical protein [Sodalis sp. dw_96]|uniref:hypothetical protein n=1 Tax=Sodalis sp. dw_96 TaxID=2719794 RepID=UPI001BD2579D|nr:hypothetical protein [Sodalis sp. dw_96]